MTTFWQRPGHTETDSHAGGDDDDDDDHDDDDDGNDGNSYYKTESIF